MKIICVSDLHGFLPVVPKCDLLIIAGDVTPFHDHSADYQALWLDTVFREWLESIPADDVIGIAGNHDYIFEKPFSFSNACVPNDLRWRYLQDESVTVGGVKIYGTPWCPNLPRWAFYATKQELDERLNQLIPTDTDIIVSHSPPRGYGDLLAPKFSMYEGHRVGEPALNDAIERVRPSHVICGHIHEGYGSYRHANGATEILNVSLMDEHYIPHDRLVEINV